MFKRQIGFGIFWLPYRRIKKYFKGAATNEIFGRIHSSTCFCGVGSVCVCSSLLTRKEAAAFHVSLSNSLITSTMIKGRTLLSFKVRVRRQDHGVQIWKLPLEHYRDQTVEFILIKLGTCTLIVHGKRTIPIDFLGQGWKIKVIMDKYGNYFVENIYNSD